MSTHAGALFAGGAGLHLLRSRRADDARFTFGTGKFGDLAGFASAIVLAMIALLIGYEAGGAVFAPGGDPFRPRRSPSPPWVSP